MNLFGLKMITSPYIPNEVPKIQVRDITLADGTRLLSDEFRERENRWWLEQFGTKEVAFILDDQRAIVIGAAMKARFERQFERMLMGIWNGQ